MSKHTPGPWRIGKFPSVVVADHPTSMRYNTGHADTKHYGGHLVCESVDMEANARLISAAPEMLEALEYLLDRRCEDSVRRAQDILAKAKGEA